MSVLLQQIIDIIEFQPAEELTEEIIKTCGPHKPRAGSFACMDAAAAIIARMGRDTQDSAPEVFKGLLDIHIRAYKDRLAANQG